MLPKILEPFLPVSEGRSSNPQNSTNSNCIQWSSSKITRKLLNLQLYSIVSIFWLGVFIYGCDFPVKVLLNQVSVSLYFLLMYAPGTTIGLYVKNNVSVAGLRVTALLQCITIFAAGYFEAIGFSALRDHQLHDRYPVTRLWAAAAYTLVLLAHFIVFFTSFVLTVSAIRSSCKKPTLDTMSSPTETA